jgi:hypothetical protein
MFNLVRVAFVKAQSKQELFEKALVLLKTIDEKDHQFEDMAATLK